MEGIYWIQPEELCRKYSKAIQTEKQISVDSGVNEIKLSRDIMGGPFF